MGWVFIIIIIICVTIICGLLFKLYMMRKAAGEISVAFQERLNTDTNTLIGLSSSDKYMRSLANCINMELRHLQQLRHRYQQGDIEVKNAITNISHDIRTPLTAICGYLELLEQEELPKKAEEYVAVIENRTQMLRDMTEELFDYSVDVSTKLELTNESVDVNRIMQESIAAFYTEFMECGITPEIHMPEKRIMRQADPAALSRVFANLLNNAIKYSDGDLQITLSEDGEILFSNLAADLNNVEVARLFDRFYTIENARRSRGLGLSISKILVEKMGGEISADYEEHRLAICVKLRE